MFFSLLKVSIHFTTSVAHVKKVMDKNPSKQISAAVENLLKTGRLVTQTGLDLQQVRMYIGANCVI